MAADLAPLWYWINERHSIYLRKTLLEGKKPPAWADPMKATGAKSNYTLDHLTNDPVLHQFRFCNVFRELDTVTIWVREHIREPYADHPLLWLMLAIARTINWPPTLETLIGAGATERGGPSSWPSDPGFEPRWMTMVLEELMKQGKKVYTGAYMIRAESVKTAPWYSWTKQRYISEIVIGRLWEAREEWQTSLHPSIFDEGTPSLEDVWGWFQSPRYVGWGPFMAFQVVLDMRHTKLLNRAPDIETWAAVGPGSRRGLNRLHGRPVGYPLRQDQALSEMQTLRQLSRSNLARHVPPLGMEDIQNSLCETDKYLRVSNNEGHPRALYVKGRGY